VTHSRAAPTASSGHQYRSHYDPSHQKTQRNSLATNPHTIPWTTITEASLPTSSLPTSLPAKRHSYSHPETPIVSPKYETTNGAQTLQYTTNAADEFYSPINSDVVAAGLRRKSRPSIHLPHMQSDPSNLSLSVSQQRFPGDGRGYELISLSSSMVDDSEPVTMEVLH
jgi:hypothetical protein